MGCRSLIIFRIPSRVGLYVVTSGMRVVGSFCLYCSSVLDGSWLMLLRLLRKSVVSCMKLLVLLTKGLRIFSTKPDICSVSVSIPVIIGLPGFPGLWILGSM
ncbi:hypothetical protein FKM82_026408 [Ascaphus truei]